MLQNERCALEPLEIDQIMQRTDFYSARDLKSLIIQALQECVTEFRVAVKWRRVCPHPIDPMNLDYALEPDPSGEVQITYDQLRVDETLKVRTVLPKLGFRHFERAFAGTKASCTDADLGKFDEWTRLFGSVGV